MRLNRASRVAVIVERETTRRCLIRRLAGMASATALIIAASSVPAFGSVTIGQLGPPDKDWSGDFDYLQPTVSSGNTYLSPVNGTITSWSNNAAVGPNQTLTFKLFRKVADPDTYMAVAHDGPQPLASGTLNTFPVNIPVKAGDIVGYTLTSPVDSAAAFLVPGEPPALLRTPGHADGASGVFAPHPIGGFRLNLTAVVVPSNSFTLGKVQRDTKKGTAKLTADLPNPGELKGSGKGAKVSVGGPAKSAKSVGSGANRLSIKAKGQKRKTLNETGKVKLKVAITFTPTNGDPRSQTLKVRLRKS